jgi:hypothetical protein
MRLNSKWLTGVSAISIAAFYFLAHNHAEKAKRLEQSTTFSDHAEGLSFFDSYLNEMKKGSSVVREHALSTSLRLPPSSTLAIISPATPLNKKEVELVAGFVKSGGKLILSFSDRDEFRNLEPLLSEFTSLQTQKNEAFENGKDTLVSLSPKTEGTMAPFYGVFQAGENYSFYGSVWWDQPGCEKPEAEKSGKTIDPSIFCYVAEARPEKGEVLLLAGLPFFANSMVERADNRKAAMRLAEWGTPFTFDEYHHFFSDRTIWDLFLLPAFAGPALGLLLSAILYFAFGYSKFHQRSESEMKKQDFRSFHDVHESMIEGLMNKPENRRSILTEHWHAVEELNSSRRLKIEERRKTKPDPAEGKPLTEKIFFEEALLILKFQQEIRDARRAPKTKGS